MITRTVQLMWSLIFANYFSYMNFFAWILRKIKFYSRGMSVFIWCPQKYACLNCEWWLILTLILLCFSSWIQNCLKVNRSVFAVVLSKSFSLAFPGGWALNRKIFPSTPWAFRWSGRKTNGVVQSHTLMYFKLKSILYKWSVYDLWLEGTFQ